MICEPFPLIFLLARFFLVKSLWPGNLVFFFFFFFFSLALDIWVN